MKKKKPTPQRKAKSNKKAVRARAKKKPAAKKAVKRAANKPAGPRWVKFVAKHGVVLASARGPVPSVAEEVAGEPIVGSWWAHAKGKAIFLALSELDDSSDIRCFKLIDGKITLAHRRMWPAIARLAQDGVLSPDRVASLQSEHMPTGEHRNVVTPFPEWLDDATIRAAQSLSVDQARAQLPWLAIS